MQHESHPHDERLAALAGADREATDDRALRDHVAACDRCRAVVDDLTHLRSALAELPDLRPSRPLQLLPPQPAPAAPRGGVLGVLKRLSAPGLAAGVVLILVGAIGGSGVLGGFALSGGAASATDFRELSEDLNSPPAPAGEATDRATLGTGSSEGFASGATPSAGTAHEPDGLAASAKAQSAVPRPNGDEDGRQSITGSPTDGPSVWLVMLGVGTVLAVGSLLVRATAQPRAG